MNLKQKSLTLDIKKAPDDDGVFEGYASVFGVVDNGMDVVEKGAFTKSLTERRPKLLWQHDWQDPIGVFDEVREDERGLYVKGRLSKDVQKGREAMALMRMQAEDGTRGIDSMSIGYVVKESYYEGDGRVRRISEVALYEISLVTFPMLEDAQVTSVKSIATIRDFEKNLRDAGYSKKEAKAIAAQGFDGLVSCRDDLDTGAEEQKQAAEALLASINSFTEELNNGNEANP